MIGVGAISFMHAGNRLWRIWLASVFAALLPFCACAQDPTGREIAKPGKKAAEKSKGKTSEKPAKQSSAPRPAPRKAAPPARLTITAAPGALIEIDGKVKGFTGIDGNLILTGIPAGEHRLSASVEGYEAWNGLFSMGTSTTRFEVPMKRKPEPGRIALTINEPGTQVVIDGHETIRPQVGQPYLITGLSTGTHQLLATKPKFREWRSSVAVEPGKTVAVKIEIKPLLDPEMLTVPEGAFEQGNNNGDKDQRPKHQVFVAAFEISRSEVTNRLYKVFVDSTGHPPPQGVGYGWHANVYPAGQDDLPVVFVSWDAAVAFCKWLSQETGHKYRLPTEAEWEKAALMVSDNYSSAGSVWEWCSDWYDPDYYKLRDRINPQGPIVGKKVKMMGFEGLAKSMRGGGFGRGQVMFRAAERNSYFPNKSRFDIGFRIVREIVREASK